jgi:hypothetical protein
MSSYIIRDDGPYPLRRKKIEGINQYPSEHDKLRANRIQVNNLTGFFNNNQSRCDQIWCSICNRMRIPMSKEQLLKIGLGGDFNEKVTKECVDDKSYTFCPGCATYELEPEWEVKPLASRNIKVMCVKCQYMITMGKRLTYAPKLMYENIEDETKTVRLGEPTATSKKKWYWHCSACGNREEMWQSDLKKTYAEHTFIMSQQDDNKLTMTRKEQEEVKSYFGGYPTSKVDEREENPPGY